MPYHDSPRSDVTRIKIIGLQQHVEVRDILLRALNCLEVPPPWALALYESVKMKVERLKANEQTKDEEIHHAAVSDSGPQEHPREIENHPG